MGWLSDIFDSVLAPTRIDDEIDAHSCTPMNGGCGDAGGSDALDWTNGFGTECDFQVPAESCDLFQSNDWASAEGW